MASKVAEAFIQLKASTVELAKNLVQARTLTMSGMKLLVAGSSAVLKTGMTGAFGTIGMVASKAGSLVATNWQAAKNALNRAKEAASALGTVFKVVAAAAVGAALTADKSSVQMNAALRGTGEAAGFSRAQLDVMAKEIGNTSGASQRLVREAQNIMLSFGHVRGDVFKEAMKDLPDLAARLGTDLPAAARELGQALQEPASGLSLLKKMGVTITPIMQEAFQRASEGSMAGWQRAQQFIVQATRKASGGANKEFQNSLAGIVQKVKSQFVDLGDAIGTALTPVFRVVAGVIGDFSAIINKVSSSLAGMFNNMGPGAQKAVTVIGMIGVAAMAIVPVFGYISAAIAPIAGLLLTILNPINLILGAVVGIGAALASAFASDKWGGQLIGVWNKIVSVGQSLWDTIAGLGSVIMVRVQPAWEALQATAARIFTAIGTFISDNEATWNEWATYVGEIVGGFIGTTLELWNGFVNFVVNAWNWISNVTGITWDGIKNVVTKTLRAISLIFSNFSLSVQIAWTAIQLGAQVAFDYLGDVFWEWYGVASGSISAVGATFSTLWNNVLAGLQYMFNRVKATFTAIYEASAALFRGRNPVTAFRASYERELRRMESTSRSYKDVGEAAADAYKRGYDSVLAANPPGESEKQKRLREQLGDQLGALDAGQAEKRRLAKEQGKTSISGKGSSDSATAEVNMTASPNGMPNMVKIQFESVGLTDMWKKVQERLTGGSMLGLTQQTAQATKETSVQAREQTAVLKRIEEKLVKAPAAVAGP